MICASENRLFFIIRPRPWLRIDVQTEEFCWGTSHAIDEVRIRQSRPLVPIPGETRAHLTDRRLAEVTQSNCALASGLDVADVGRHLDRSLKQFQQNNNPLAVFQLHDFRHDTVKCVADQSD